MSIQAEQFRTGGDRNFGYLLADEESREACIVDPSYNPSLIAGQAAAEGFKVRYIFCTHGHHDHTNGNEEAERLTGCRPLLYGDICPVTGLTVRDGAIFPLGHEKIRIMHTPGHTADSISIYAGSTVCTGDTLFVGKVGGTDLEEGAREEYRSLHEKLLRLPEETAVMPGHDYGTAPRSTIGNEKKTNPFLLQPDLDAFVELKRNWAVYKKAHGIS